MHGDAARLVARLDGLLLSGGADIAPGRYGAEVEAELFGPELERDALELAVTEAAMTAGIPALGLCRGRQLLHVHGGGTLNQHVPDQVATTSRRTTSNEVSLPPGS